MVFLKSNILILIAALAAITNIDAFAVIPGSRLQTQSHNSCFIRQFSRASSQHHPLSVSLSSVDELVAADDNDDDESSKPSPEDFIVSAGDLDTDAPAEDSFEPSDRFLHKTKLDEIRKKYARHENDSGSPEFQVAGMTERIVYLTKHMKNHPKDFSTRRGLVALVNKRRRILNFLFREDVDRYKELVSSMGIRHKPQGRVRSREEKYAQFPPQKSKKN